MIDSDGFRPNVGIIITDGCSRVFWARRLGQDAWQFPQGGIKREESPEQALFRELHEEVGLGPDHVEIMGCTRSWLRYRLPEYLIRHHRKPLCIGQKQVWFMLRLLAEEAEVDFRSTGHPEFDHWRWVDYWQPLREVVFFKRRVYDQALSELGPLLFPAGLPTRPPRRNRHPRRLRRERS